MNFFLVFIFLVAFSLAEIVKKDVYQPASINSGAPIALQPHALVTRSDPKVEKPENLEETFGQERSLREKRRHHHHYGYGGYGYGYGYGYGGGWGGYGYGYPMMGYGYNGGLGLLGLLFGR